MHVSSGPCGSSVTEFPIFYRDSSMENGTPGVSTKGIHVNLGNKRTLTLSLADRSLKLHGAYTLGNYVQTPF